MAILPLLFIHFSENAIKAKTITVIPLVLADTNFAKRFPEFFKDYKGTFPPKRNYTDIVFTGNEKSDQIKLDFAQIKTREILSANDTASGLHFQFSDNSQYWTFVKSIDMLRAEGAKTYMPLDKDLWFYYFPPDTTEYFICGTTYKEIAYKPKPAEWLYGIWQSSRQIILLFTGYICAVFILKRQKQKVI